MKFLTTGEIAKRLNADRDAVAYALRKTKVEPVGRAGQVRVFSEGVLAAVREFLMAKAQAITEEQDNGEPNELNLLSARAGT